MRRTYLDGLRGWASLFVVFSHMGPMFLLANYKLPVLPFFLDGLLAVYVFFVLSGYVLSIGYFEHGDRSQLVALGLRRYPRLTIPILISCLLAFALVNAGAMSNATAGSTAASPWLSSFYTFETSIPSVLRFSLWDVYIDDKAPSYNAVLWTMRYEFWGSLILVVSLWILRSRAALVTGYAIFSVACVYFQSPLFAFVIGVALAQGTAALQRKRAQSPRAASLAAVAILILALTVAALRTGWLWSPVAMSIMAGAVLLALVVCTPLQQALSGGISARLGHLSFPLYLTHLLVICSWSSWLYMLLYNHDVSAVPRAVAVLVSTVALSMAAAKCFAPVEQMAIRFSHRLSDTLLSAKAPGARRDA